MKCKKWLMGLAALLILIFHLYIPVTGSAIEQAFYRSAYIGVDFFFFVSAFSVASRGVMNYPDFLKNRLLMVYVPFVLFSAVRAIYKTWSMGRFFRVISGIEFFKQGGGAFLWFFVAIMLMYLISPVLLKLKDAVGLRALWLMLGGWLMLVLILEYVVGYTDIFIFLNRFPIYFIGLYYDEIRKHVVVKDSGESGGYREGWRIPVLVGALFAAGAFLLWKYCSIYRLQDPIDDFYYILVIPVVLAVVMVADYLSMEGPAFLGNISLELYGLQMLFGFELEGYILGLTGQRGLLTFLITIAILIIAATILKTLKNVIIKYMQKE